MQEPSGCQKIGMAYAGCFTLFGVFFLCGVSIFIFWLNAQYDQYGTAMQAQIDDCDIQRGKNNSLSVRLIYTYEVSGKRYYAQASRDDDDCTRYPIGGQIAAQYLSNNPASSRLADENMVTAALFVGAGSIVMAFISFSIFRHFFFNPRKEKPKRKREEVIP